MPKSRESSMIGVFVHWENCFVQIPKTQTPMRLYVYVRLSKVVRIQIRRLLDMPRKNLAGRPAVSCSNDATTSAQANKS